MVLTLERMGLDIHPKYNAEIYGLTDFDNHRLRAVINTKDGKEVTVDFGHGTRLECCKEKKPLVANPCCAWANGDYYDEQGNCWAYRGFDFLWEDKISFTKENILKAVNSVSAVRYDSIEVVDYVKL